MLDFKICMIETPEVEYCVILAGSILVLRPGSILKSGDWSINVGIRWSRTVQRF